MCSMPTTLTGLSDCLSNSDMNEESLSQLYLKDAALGNLMRRRVLWVLLAASPYDAFMVEEDGGVGD